MSCDICGVGFGRCPRCSRVGRMIDALIEEVAKCDLRPFFEAYRERKK